MTRIHLLVVSAFLLCMPVTADDGKSSPAPDAPIWAEHAVIDAHAHVGEFAGFDLDLKHLLAGVERFGIDKVLVSNIDGAELEQTANLDETATNRRTLDLVRAHPGVLRGIVWTRPTDGSSEAVEPFLDERLDDGSRVFVGLKIHPEMNGFPADDARVDPYFEMARTYGLPVVYHCGTPDSNSDPKRIIAAARRHPEVPVVLYHMGFRRTHDAALAVVAEALEEGVDNLYVGTAQASPEAVVTAVQRLGADRVVFGTDAVYFGAEHYERYRPMVDALADALTRDELALVLGGNARRLFPLRPDGS